MTYAEILIQKGKRGAAAFVQAECHSAKVEPAKSPMYFNALLDHLLNPERSIDDVETIDWCQWLVSGGTSYEDFACNVREYDNTAKCGLVWTADFVAYRCRTCGISQCMSLCAECFKCGNHEGHDYNMFKSQAGGACDCGDSSVMKESGFCTQHHGSRAPTRSNSPPADLMVVAEMMVPRIILRLLQHLRVNTVHSAEQFSAAQALERYEKAIEEANRFLKLLHDFSALGAAMRTVMTRALVDMQTYARLTNINEDTEYSKFMIKSKELYEDALRSLPNPDPPVEFQDCTALTAQLQHKTFLEELVFWTVKYEFPEKLVCLLLKMLPDIEYKEAFTRSFVLHYSRVSLMLVRSSNSDKLSNRVVHVSVQLFSNEALALLMTESLSLLHIMVSSLRNMMSAVLVPCEMNDQSSEHLVVDCSKHVMRDHCYWPLVSDLSSVLGRPPIAFRFMSDNSLLTMWFDFLKMFQGMNLNVRVSGSHIEFEPNTYYASFSGELEASASPMWALVSHIRSNTSREYSENILRRCLAAIREWMNTIKFTDYCVMDSNKASFHIPLHRYFSVVLRQAVKAQDFSLKELLPDQEMLTLMMQHPLRIQTAFYEIMSGLWVRNGLQIKGQAMTYIQCHFCKSMVDADLFLLQIGATHLPTSQFVSRIIESFQIDDWLSMSKNRIVKPNRTSRVYRDQEQELQMIESCLIFLVSILSLRTNIGLDEEILTRLEMVSLLCMGDKTHSMLYEHMPEKCGTTVPLELFDKVLSGVAQYKSPKFEASGSMQQGMYLPKSHVWEELYDPIYVLLRAVHRREFQTSMERFNTFARKHFEGDEDRLATVKSPWPPWRLPPPVDEGFADPRQLLHSRYMHGFILNLLYNAVHGKVINDFVTSLAVHLLELTVTYPQRDGFSGKEVAVSKPWVMANEPVDLKYDTWFPTDWISANLRHVVSVIFSHQSNKTMARAAAAAATAEGAHTLATSLDDSDQNAVAQSMEVDQVSDVSDGDECSESYQVETPSSITMEGPPMFPSSGGHHPMEGVAPPTSSPGATHSLSYVQPLAITGPSSFPVVARNLQGMMPSMNMANAPAIRMASGGLQVTLDSISNENSQSSSSIHSQQDSQQQTEIEGCPATTMINESIISLMLQLHSKYSGRSDSYTPCDRRSGISVSDEYRQSRIGDACFYIEKVLDRICELDEPCRHYIDTCRQQLWPFYHAQEAQRDQEQEEQEAEAKRRRAKQRKEQLLAQLAEQRKRFMKESDVQMDMDTDDAATSQTDIDSVTKEEKYTCCHCLLNQVASVDKPIGLVTWIQSSSLLSHRYHKDGHLILPVGDEEEEVLRASLDESLGNESESYFSELNRQFSTESVLMSVNKSWKGGIHIQSCGHHMHYDCRSSYCETLKQTIRVARDQALDTDGGEFICPMCRQPANALLPVAPEPANTPATVFPALVKDRLHTTAKRIHQILTEDSVHLAPGPNELGVQMSKVMEFFTTITLPQFRLDKTSCPNQAVAMFICSIARTNLEADVVQRGGSFAEIPVDGAAAVLDTPTHTNRPRCCFVPLMHVLAIHMGTMPGVRLGREWALLTQSSAEETGALNYSSSQTSLVLSEREGQGPVPLLMQDTVTMMLHFILSLPTNMEKAYFDTIIQSCFNLHMVQILARLAAGLADHEREMYKTAFESNPTGSDIVILMGHVVTVLERVNFFGDLAGAETESNEIAGIDLKVLIESAEELALPFLRIAALIRHYFFGFELPYVSNEAAEYSVLVKFLDLGPGQASAFDQQQQQLHESPNEEPQPRSISDPVSSAICWFGDKDLEVWIQNFFPFVQQNREKAMYLQVRNLLWKQPRLLTPPREYDKIFAFYHGRACRKCGTVPKDPTICLMCGTVVCLKENCCKTTIGDSAVCETVHHAQNCGGGTGIFLAVNSSTIVCIRGKRACIWGSIYLDSFGEEDKELKRGKPLFLHHERFQLLEHQWLNHKFDHTTRKWVMHRDAI